MITARHLRKSFGQNLAVDDLSLEVAAGEIFGLVGPDGAGKTTTIRLLCGAMLPDIVEKAETPTWLKRVRRSTTHPLSHSAGLTGADLLAEVRPESPPALPDAIIQIGGIDMLHQPDQGRSLIGYLPQRFSLYEDLSVMENLRFFTEVRGLSSAEWQPRCLEILRFVGLEPYKDRLAGHLSGGMKQKLGLAAALAHRPRVLLLDEPTTGVDPVTRQDFWQLIIRLVSQGDHGGVAVLVSTPYMDEAARCTRLGFMRAGRLLISGTPAQLRLRLEDQILELRGQPLSLLRRVAEAEAGVEDARMFGDRIHLRASKGLRAEVEGRLRKRIPAEGGEITLLRPVPSQLEDVFISLIQ